MRAFLSAVVYLIFLVFILGPLGALIGEGGRSGLAALWQELTRPEAVFALRLTLLVSVLTVAINTIVGVFLALLLVRDRFRGQGLFQAAVDLPLSVSPVIAGLMLVLVYGPYTMLGAFLTEHGIRIIFALPGIVLATLFITMPLVVRQLVPVLRENGLEQEEAAYTLGASPWITFWKVTLPSLKWSLLYGAVMTLARSMGEFGAVLVVSGNLIMQTQTATLYAYDSVVNFNMAGAYAVSLLLLAISFITLLIMQTLGRNQEVAN